MSHNLYAHLYAHVQGIFKNLFFQGSNFEAIFTANWWQLLV